MGTLTVYGLEIPLDVDTLDHFRDWVGGLAEGSPQVHFWQGRVCIETSPQHYRTHAPVVLEINRVLSTLTRERNLGRYYAPPSWITEESCGLSTEPDGFLVLWDTLRANATRINPERECEMLGRPDFALEVVSRTSERKDLVDLVDAYARAGVREYWTVDARPTPPELMVRVLDAQGKWAHAVAAPEGWIRSPIFGPQFRLTTAPDRLGQLEVRLEYRE